MAKQPKIESFDPVTPAMTPAVAAVLAPLVGALDRADRLGVLVQESRYGTAEERDFYQTIKTSWRSICKQRGRPCLLGYVIQTLAPVVATGHSDLVWDSAVVTMPNAKILHPLVHWLFLASDVQIGPDIANGAGTIGAKDRAKHLVLTRSASVTEACFVHAAGQQLWESFLQNIQERQDWREILKAAPSPAPALVRAA